MQQLGAAPSISGGRRRKLGVGLREGNCDGMARPSRAAHHPRLPGGWKGLRSSQSSAQGARPWALPHPGRRVRSPRPVRRSSAARLPALRRDSGAGSQSARERLRTAHRGTHKSQLWENQLGRQAMLRPRVAAAAAAPTTPMHASCGGQRDTRAGGFPSDGLRQLWLCGVRWPFICLKKPAGGRRG